MTQTAARRGFPPVPGPFGWLGAGLLILGIACQMASDALLVVLAYQRNTGLVIPVVATFLISLTLIAAAWIAWRIGRKRTGIRQPTSMTRVQRVELTRTVAIMNLGSLLGVGGFLYLAFTLPGTWRRFAIAAIPVFLSTIISYLGLIKLRKITGGRPRGSWG